MGGNVGEMNNQKEKQKKEEKAFLESFLKRAKYDAEEICMLPNDPPDARIILDGKQIGIEITEFHVQEDRAIEAVWEELKRELMSRIKKYPELKNFMYVLHFKEPKLPDKKERGNFADQCIQFVLNYDELTNNQLCLFDSQKFPLMKKYLGNGLERIPNGIDNFQNNSSWCRNNTMDFAWTDDPSRIMEKPLRKKIKALDDNRWEINPDEKWILIVSGHRASQMIGARETYKDIMKGSKFDMVFIYDVYQPSPIYLLNGNQWEIFEKRNF